MPVLSPLRAHPLPFFFELETRAGQYFCLLYTFSLSVSSSVCVEPGHHVQHGVLGRNADHQGGGPYAPTTADPDAGRDCRCGFRPRSQVRRCVAAVGEVPTPCAGHGPRGGWGDDHKECVRVYDHGSLKEEGIGGRESGDGQSQYVEVFFPFFFFVSVCQFCVFFTVCGSVH